MRSPGPLSIAHDHDICACLHLVEGLLIRWADQESAILAVTPNQCRQPHLHLMEGSLVRCATRGRKKTSLHRSSTTSGNLTMMFCTARQGAVSNALCGGLSQIGQGERVPCDQPAYSRLKQSTSPGRGRPLLTSSRLAADFPVMWRGLTQKVLLQSWMAGRLASGTQGSAEVCHVKDEI